MRILVLAVALASLLALASCADDGTAADQGPMNDAASAVIVTDEVQCKQLGGGWTFHDSRSGGGLVPPGDGATSVEPGKVAAGEEANLPADVLDASRVEREANGWGEIDVMYLTALTDEDPLRGAQHLEGFGGDFADISDADHKRNIERLSKQLDESPAC